MSSTQNDQIINGTFTEEQQWESFLEEVTTNLGKDPVSMSLSEIELVNTYLYVYIFFYLIIVRDFLKYYLFVFC